MSYRKVHSQRSIPFSWEAKPGVSKVIANQEDNCPAELGFHALSFFSDQGQHSGDSPKPKMLDHHEIKIPPPPCPILRAPSRSSSTKGLRWNTEADPFLLAFKECTKSTSTLNYDSGKLGSENSKKVFGLIPRVKKSRFSMFSCKSSCDVRDDNLVKLSQLPPLLPPLPKETSRSFW
ncbi:hypothetical protein FF1_027504 [Malus domestica]|uniref:uncharacterized protein LOC126591516 n=1 Tax=Malus sylvestris TaxID=3752 RepID=UPI0021ACA3BA|nr:uncharacterized protein LOC126591516 [Malus sylvestris]